MSEGGDPRPIVQARGMTKTTSADELGAAVADVLAKNAAKVAKYRAGKTGLLGFFVGQVMKA